MPKRNWFLLFFATALVFIGTQASALSAEQTALRTTMQRWIDAVVDEDKDELAKVLSRDSLAFYADLKEIALHGNRERLAALDFPDQMQVLLLRSMIKPAALEEMAADDVVLFALEKGMIGVNLRKSDILAEIIIDGDTARGRLHKFGDPAKPDRYSQYFVRENGSWRVHIRGELERISTAFERFYERLGIPPAEAAFLIVETRLLRKVVPADFEPPLKPLVGGAPEPAKVVTPAAHPKQNHESAIPLLRLVSVRTSSDVNVASAITVEDHLNALRYVLKKGDALPEHGDYVVAEVDADRVLFRSPHDELELSLNRKGKPLNDRRKLTADELRSSPLTMLELAEQGASYEKMMMTQWRHVGLRDRAQLLQQGWLTPDFGTARGPKKEMIGLRVRQLARNSFWAQLGLEEGDILEEINGRRINDLAGWRDALQVAQTSTDITVVVRRNEDDLLMRTRTIEPR